MTKWNLGGSFDNDENSDASLHNKSINYKVSSKTEIFVEGRESISFDEENNWNVKIINEDERIIYEIGNQSISRSNRGQFEDLFKIVNKIYSCFDYLVVKVDEDGGMVEILNKQEIIEKWDKVLKLDLLPFFANGENQHVASAITQEVSKPLLFLNKNWLYFLFFLPIRTKDYESYITNHKKHSSILNNEMLEIQSKIGMSKRLTNQLEYKVHSTLNALPKDLDSKFKENYGQLFKIEDMKFAFEQNSYHIYDIQSGILDDCRCTIFEQLTDSYYYKANYNIKKVEL